MTDQAVDSPYPETLPAGTIPPDGTPLGALVHVLSLNVDRQDHEPAIPGTHGHYPHETGTHRFVGNGPVFTFVTWGDLRRIAEDAQP